MEELADVTGGTFFHDSNDLDAGLKDLAETPEYVYLLELPLDNVKPNGSYSPLEGESGSERLAGAGAPRLHFAQAGEEQEIEASSGLRW